MTHSERLTPERLAEIAARRDLIERGDISRVGNTVYFGNDPALKQWVALLENIPLAEAITLAATDIAALLSHAAALEDEIAALRRVAEALESREWTCKHYPEATRWLSHMPPYVLRVKGHTPVPGVNLHDTMRLAAAVVEAEERDMCPDCHALHITHDDGRYCRNCGWIAAQGDADDNES